MKKLKLYHVSQKVNTDYDTYSDFVVVAENEEEARTTNPNEFYKWHDNAWYFQYPNNVERKIIDDSWCLASQVKVKLIGDAVADIKKEIICSSFHAG